MRLACRWPPTRPELMLMILQAPREMAASACFVVWDATRRGRWGFLQIFLDGDVAEEVVPAEGLLDHQR